MIGILLFSKAMTHIILIIYYFFSLVFSLFLIKYLDLKKTSCHTVCLSEEVLKLLSICVLCSLFSFKLSFMFYVNQLRFFCFCFSYVLSGWFTVFFQVIFYVYVNRLCFIYFCFSYVLSGCFYK